MAKTNYRKVEEFVTQGLHDMQVNHLLELADVASGIGRVAAATEEQQLTPAQMMIIIDQDLKWMRKKDPKIYKNLKIKKKDFKELTAKAQDFPDKITKKELEKMKKMKKKVSTYKQEKFPPTADDKLVESEILRHINKRHNVNEKWLPLR